jgi:glucokinase
MNNFYLGIDIGGTHVRCSIYNETNHNIMNIDKVVFKRSGIAIDEVNDNICSLIHAIIKNNTSTDDNLKGIGVSTAALFNRASGSITMWPNNQIWNGFPLKKYLEDTFNVPVELEDDANSAALAEQLTGSGKNIPNFAYITISTGIGCGLILNNSLYTGSNGWAGELGHIQLSESSSICSCGSKGCFQSLASGPAILKKFTTSEIFSNYNNRHLLSLNSLVDLAQQGDLLIESLFVDAGEHIGKMLSAIVMLLDIPLIILGGGVMEAGDLIFNPLNSTLNDRLKQFNRTVVIKKSQLGDNIGAIGALNLIYKKVNNRIIDSI